MLLLKTQSFLQALSSISLGGILKAILGYIFLAIDSVVYFFVSQGFKMYIALAQFKLFDDKVFDDLINRTYIIIGVIALFIVAYALLNSIINPDNASKGDKSLSKIVKNFIFAIIGIAIVPTVFNYFYYFQRVVLCNNLIPKILLAQKGDDSQADLLNDDKIGTQFATYLFQSFFYPKSIENMNMTDIDNDGDLLKSEAVKVEVGLIDDVFSNEESVNIEKYKDYDSDNKGNYNLQMAYEGAMNGEMFFTAFRPFLLGDVGFANSVLNNTVNYMIIISTIAGVYCAYVLASLCIDMAIRAVKLGYLELIAPLPIMTLIIPGKDGVFKAWIKKTGSCAFEVFTRLFIVSFVIYLIRTIPQLFTATSFSYGGCTTSFGVITALLIRALVYCGLLTFVKQAPKFLSEATGIKSDGFKLGIADKLGEMALIGGAAKNGVRAAQGAATGALGGLATGLFNRDKINWKSAAMQGATQGFKGKGNQFSKQRESTFQSIGEYKDKTQGLFGGESKVSKFINNHKKDVENDYGEKANIKKHNGMSSKRYSEIKDGFSEDKINDRIDSFKKSQEYKAAEAYAAERMKATGETSEAVKESEISNYLNNLKANTTDKDLKRRISQYESDNTVLEQIGDLEKCKSEVSSATNNYSKAQQKYSNAQRMISDNDDKIAQAQSVLPSKNDALEASNAELSSKQQNIDAAIQRANAEKSKLDAAVASIIKIHPELKDGFDKANDYDEIKKLLGDFKLKLDEQDRATGGAILNNGRTELNQAMSAIREYDNITVQKESIQKDYDIALQSQKTAQEEYDSYVKVIDDLQRENETLLGQSREAQEEIQKFRKAIKDAKDSYEKSQAEFVKKVNDAAELVYNGDASINKNGTDDLDILASALNSAIENNDKQLADALYEQIKIMENYRGAKQGITDMNKEINYEKELYNYFKKQKKDE